MLFFFCNIDLVLIFFITFVLFLLSKMSEGKLIFSMYLQKLESIFKSSIFYFLKEAVNYLELASIKIVIR